MARSGRGDYGDCSTLPSWQRSLRAQDLRRTVPEGHGGILSAMSSVRRDSAAYRDGAWRCRWWAAGSSSCPAGEQRHTAPIGPTENSIILCCAAGPVGGHHTLDRCRRNFATEPTKELHAGRQSSVLFRTGDCDALRVGTRHARDHDADLGHAAPSIAAIGCDPD
jgi:hypothetical protein